PPPDSLRAPPAQGPGAARRPGGGSRGRPRRGAGPGAEGALVRPQGSPFPLALSGGRAEGGGRKGWPASGRGATRRNPPPGGGQVPITVLSVPSAVGPVAQPGA